MGYPVTFKEKIVVSGQKENWANARETAKPKGGLVKHPMLDRYLREPDNRSSLLQSASLAPGKSIMLWSDNLLAVPGQGRRFQKGEPIYNPRTGLLLLPESFANLDLDMDKLGLFINPLKLHSVVFRGQQALAIEPKSIEPVHPAVQSNRGSGYSDSKTGMVVESSQKDVRDRNEQRVVLGLTTPDSLFGSVGRVVDEHDGKWRNVYVVCDPSAIGAFSSATVAFDIEIANTENARDRIIIENVSLADVGKIAVWFPMDALKDLNPAQRAAVIRVAETYADAYDV